MLYLLNCFNSKNKLKKQSLKDDAKDLKNQHKSLYVY